ncbi:MAG: radical SAM protein [Armatimonadota bacterium]|jgi:MoaA/NifB/PqqE/SkfB family radical SAM enzyme
MFRKLGVALRGGRFIRRAPQLVTCYLKNRMRSASLLLDVRRPSGRSAPPRCVTLRLSLRCNLQCKMCYYMSDAIAKHAMGQLPSLPYDTAARAAREAVRLGAYVAITGGEPLLYDRLPDAIAEVKRNGGICALVTNGTLLRQRAAELARAGPDLVAVSVLGPPAVHDEITGVEGSFARAAAGIQEARARLDGNGRTALVVNTAISPANIGHLRELVDIAHDWPIDAMNVQHLWFTTPEMLRVHHMHFGSLFQPCLTESHDGRIDPGAVDELATELASLRGAKLPFALHIFPDLPPQQIRRYYDEPAAVVGPRRATCAWLFCEVTPTGDVSPCYGYTAGSVTESSLADVWNGERFRRFRRTLAESRAFPICARCCALFRRD